MSPCHRVISIGVAFLVLVGVGACSPATVSRGPERESSVITSSEYAQALFVLTNEERRSSRLPALDYSVCAEREALIRATDLVGQDLHHAPMLSVLETCSTEAAAENLAKSEKSPSAVISAWMGSAGHRNNILDPRWTATAVSCVDDNGQWLCSQLFVNPDPVNPDP